MKFAALLSAMSIAATASAAIVGTANDGRARQQPAFFLRTGEKLSLTCMKSGRIEAVSWFQIEPELQAYDNQPGRKVPPAEIRYRRSAASAMPAAHLELRFATPGTRYYCAGPIVPKTFQSAEPIHRKFAGEIVQVVVRAGDDYCDYLGELAGTPFLMGPAIAASGWHQTDQRVGSDCAAFATYGRRRMGKAIAYRGPAGIVKFLYPIARAPLVCSRSNDAYRNPHGASLRVGTTGIRVGDIVHFGPQVSVFYEDRGIRGQLDANDLVFQSWGITPHVTSLRKSGFFRFPIRVYRWR